MIGKIEGPGPIRTAQPVKRTAKTSSTSSAGFSRHLDETDDSNAAHGIGATSSVSGVLGLQEVDDALAHASKGKMRAQDILDRLDELRVDLLTGALSREKLLQLSRIVNNHRAQISDPRLGEILDEIDLRAQVELAKYSPVGN